jgi:hypothetical protein
VNVAAAVFVYSPPAARARTRCDRASVSCFNAIEKRIGKMCPGHQTHDEDCVAPNDAEI